MLSPSYRPGGSIRTLVAALVVTSALSSSVLAQVPTIISYQSRVVMNSTNFGGTGQFRFALVNAGGATTYWRNSPDANVDGRPDTAVALSVSGGAVTTLLGDTTVPNMAAIPANVFENNSVFLRVWFDGGAGIQQLSPDQRIVSVGYALMAASVPNGSITTAKLATGVMHPTNFPANTVTSAQVADDLDLGATNVTGRLDVFRTSAGTPAITLFGNASQISTYGADGLEQTRLWGTSFGELLLYNSLANNATAVRLSSQGTTGGQLELRNTNGSNRAVLEGENVGGTLTLYQGDGSIGAVLYGNEGVGSGALSLRNTNGSARLRAYGGPSSGQLELYDTDGTQTMLMQGAEGTGGAQMIMRQANGATTVQFDAEFNAGGGGLLALYNAAGVQTVALQADEVVGDGAQLVLRNSAGTASIVLDANQGTEPRVSVQGTVAGKVIEITGGSDLSEKFHVGGSTEVKPGMLVCIDPDQPGHLIPSGRAYNRTAAGVVSGAGGVQPGMVMGQAGTLADGKYPVALSGRVYALVDAANGAIQPGDMITTSDIPGHGMKATDTQQSHGAIIGKAMTGLKSGRGLVLVLVSLQ